MWSSWLYGSWIYYYLCNLPITTSIVSTNPAQARCTRYNNIWFFFEEQVFYAVDCFRNKYWHILYVVEILTTHLDEPWTRQSLQIFKFYSGGRGGYIAITLSVRPSVHTFITDISDSTGRNYFIFDMWFWHGDLYRVSPFQVYCTSTSCLPCDLDFFMLAIMEIFVTDISASTGRNDFIFDIWLWHGDLYRVSPFQVYCTSTSCLRCDLRIFHVFTAFSGNECWDIYKFDTNERVGVFLARRSMQHLVSSGLVILNCYKHPCAGINIT